MTPNAFRTIAIVLAVLCVYLTGVVLTGDTRWDSHLFQSRSCGSDSFCIAVKREDYFKQMTGCLSGALSDLRGMRAGTECLDNLTAKIKRDPDYSAVGLPTK